MAECDVCIVGGGPAGMMAGLLFARAGLKATVLEKHGDFLRDFRGDTVHPATLDLFDELGLLPALLKQPHDPVGTVGAVIGGRRYRVADFRHLPGPGKFVAMMPQWHFLDFVSQEASRWPGFALRMNTRGAALEESGGRLSGVVTSDGETIRTRLVIAADGRDSGLRRAANLPLRDLGAPIDVLWFRVSKPRTAENRTEAYVGDGEMIVTIDRGDYFQCARVIRKGGADSLRAAGLDRFRAEVARVAPPTAAGVQAITDWSDVKLLEVSLNRLTRWHRPGLLAIGDAAHAMSPVGGVGINLAIQDAVAAANILAAPMAARRDVDALLARVQDRRMLPVRIVQAMQRTIHERVIASALQGAPVRAPAALRLLDAVPLLQRIPARLLGLGVRREHIQSPDVALSEG